MWINLLPKSFQYKIKNNSGVVSAISNSGWLFFDKVVRLGLGLIVGAWIARHLGPEQYGVLAYVLAYLAFFQAVALLGLDGIVVRNLSTQKENAGKILGTAFILRFSVGVVSWLIAICSIGFVDGWNEQSTIITALAGASLIFQAADTIDLWFQSNSQSKRTVKVKLIAYLLSNSIKVYFILSDATLIYFSFAMTLEFLISALGLFISYRKYTCKQSWIWVKNDALQMLNESWPFVIAGLSTIIYMRIDQIMIKKLLGEYELGLYAAVLPFSTAWNFIPLILSTSFAPFIADKKAQCNGEYMLYLGFLFRLFSGLAITISVCTAIISPYLIDFLYGEAYQKASTVLSIHVFTNVFISLGIAQSLWILNERKSKISLYRTIIGAIFCITANYFVIPSYGIVGASVVAVLSQFVASFMSNVLLAPMIFKMQFLSLFQLRINYGKL